MSIFPKYDEFCNPIIIATLVGNFKCKRRCGPFCVSWKYEIEYNRYHTNNIFKIRKSKLAYYVANSQAPIYRFVHCINILKIKYTDALRCIQNLIDYEKHIFGDFEYITHKSSSLVFYDAQHGIRFIDKICSFLCLNYNKDHLLQILSKNYLSTIMMIEAFHGMDEISNFDEQYFYGTSHKEYIIQESYAYFQLSKKLQNVKRIYSTRDILDMYICLKTMFNDDIAKKIIKDKYYNFDVELENLTCMTIIHAKKLRYKCSIGNDYDIADIPEDYQNWVLSTTHYKDIILGM
jgi:hypothetical protein